MNNELTLFSNLHEIDNFESGLKKKRDMEERLINSRKRTIEKIKVGSGGLFENVEAEESQDIFPRTSKNLKKEKTVFTKKEALKEVTEYFGGDELAASVWIDKYALKNENEELLERTPDDMHRRIAREFARIEKKYPNPMSEELIFSLLQDFKYIIPQGSPMAGIGNHRQIASLSNCFVIGSNHSSDSYGGIMKTDEEQVQLMKRRGGVGHDISHIRPAGSSVKNCANTSTGVVPFMERYSNTTREVAQDGRRGALMLSISIKHPDAEKFIDAKMTLGKITGANVSVKIDDHFMYCVKTGEPYKQQYPIDSDNPTHEIDINARELWNKIIHNSWKSAEPGVLFWDTIRREAIPDCYKEEGFETVSTNPCGEIPLCPYDSCRLLAVNLYSYVENPFTEEAFFNMPLFKEHIQYAQRLMDDLVDLEIEKIDKIIEKVLSDPETEDVKRVELELWKKIRAQTLKGRRTGLGITAEGDMLAALNIQYASDYAIAFSTEVHKQLALSAYESSVTMAKERGAFPVYQAVNEANNPFVLRLKQADPKLYEDMVRYGRRNIALLTIAPTGSVSICTQTTSGIEPAFNIVYNRRRKVNPNDNNIKKLIRDTTGDYFEEYRIFHPKFITWAKKHNYTKEQLENLSEEALNKLIENSPYYKSTAADTNYVKKVELQGSIQKWVDHSISVTINLPSTVTKETVNELYLKAWEVGCKGLTVYREGSREGILQTAQNKTNAAEDKPVLKRPKELKADVIRFKNNNEDWVAFVGVLNGKPYEIFTGKTEEDRFPIPKWVERGNIIQTVNENNVKSYDFQYFDKDGYEVIMRGLSRCFNPDFWNYAKMISGLLRHHIPLDSIINIVSGLNFNEASINSWRNGVIRAIKKFIQDGSKPAEMRCPNCEQESMEIKEGCAVCTNCGFSKCGG